MVGLACVVLIGVTPFSGYCGHVFLEGPVVDAVSTSHAANLRCCAEPDHLPALPPKEGEQVTVRAGQSAIGGSGRQRRPPDSVADVSCVSTRGPDAIGEVPPPMSRFLLTSRAS